MTVEHLFQTISSSILMVRDDSQQVTKLSKCILSPNELNVYSKCNTIYIYMVLRDVWDEIDVEMINASWLYHDVYCWSQ